MANLPEIAPAKQNLGSLAEIANDEALPTDGDGPPDAGGGDEPSKPIQWGAVEVMLHTRSNQNG